MNRSKIFWRVKEQRLVGEKSRQRGMELEIVDHAMKTYVLNVKVGHLSV